MTGEKTGLLFQTPILPLYGQPQCSPSLQVLQIPTGQSDSNTQRDTPKFTFTPAVAVTAFAAVAFVIILAFILFIPREKQLIATVLQQSAVASNSKISAQEFKDITIPQGRLRGFTKKSRQGREYTAFYMVPYAEPPVGDFRFKDPIAPRSGWEGLRAIPHIAPQCIQREKYSDTIQAVGEEDCLYSNIYVPKISNQDPLPVMVYIHGGQFVDGNGSRYGVEYFMDEDVIVATMQYRLGPLGFLTTEDDVIHGNMGFKDQVQMLQWTKDNIQYFGGDPNRVTIFGNSAGAMGVTYLVLSPMATGLFHRAISQSGSSACANMVTVHNPRQTVEEVAKEVECDASNSTEFLACLQTKDAGDIALVRTSRAEYGLTVENRQDNQVFMPDKPYNVLRDNPNKVPYIIGVVSDEWAGMGLSLISTPEIAGILNRHFAIAGTVMGINMTTVELESVKEFYFGDKEIGNDTFREVINMVSDPGLIHCSYVTAHLHAQHSPAYLYLLTKPPAVSYVEKSLPDFPAKELGIVTHADELQYFFLYDGYPEIPVGDPEYYEFSRYLVKQWATFAANGKPSEDWEQVRGNSSASTFWMELNDKPGRTQRVADRMNFWDQFSHIQLGYV